MVAEEEEEEEQQQQQKEQKEQKRQMSWQQAMQSHRLLLRGTCAYVSTYHRSRPESPWLRMSPVGSLARYLSIMTGTCQYTPPPISITHRATEPLRH